MSLILEALKKSENQRRLGEMPNLATPVIATRKRRSLLPVLAAAIAVALAAGWWLQRGGTPALAPAERPVATVPASQPAAERRTALTDTAKAPPTRTPRAAADAAKPAAPADAVADVQTPAAQPTPPTAAAATKPLPAPAPAVAAGPAATNPVVNPSPAPAAPVVTPAPALPAQPALPKLWELPYATRRELPAMQLTMQVYSDDPGKRFVILNDVRQTEGAELGKGLYLREIRQDGLIMEVDGTRFFYPRGGR